MKIMNLVGLLFFSILTCFIFIGFEGGLIWAGDYYLEKQNETFIDGKPMGGASVLKLWVKEDRVRYFNSNDKDNIIIIRMDEDKTYQLNEVGKTVKEIDLKTKFTEAEKEMQVTSQKTDKKKKVDQWEAYQVVVTTSAKGMSTELEYWFCEEIKLPLEARLRMSSYFGQRKIMEELKKYPGYPVETIAHLKVQEKKIDMITKLAKIEEKKIDEHLFEIPSDYKKVEMPLPESTKPASPAVPESTKPASPAVHQGEKPQSEGNSEGKSQADKSH